MCTVCRHNQVKDIDRALLTGASLTSLSKKYGFGASALHRHQEHLKQKMARAQNRFHDGLHQGLLCKLNLVLELVLGVVRGAKAGEDFKLFLQASREVTRIISLMLKMKVPLEPEMIYCLMASPQWDLQDSLLPNAFQALSATRQTLAVNLFAPCPDPEPELIPATGPPLETQNPKLETPQPPASQPITANHPTKKREISAKLARKIPRSKNINEKYQDVTLCEKNSPKKRENLFQKLLRKWEKSGKLPGKTTLNTDNN
jgi:hypothetical protein